MGLSSLLNDIIKEKQREIKNNKAIMPVSLIENMIVDDVEPKRGFYEALQNKINSDNNAIIAELRKACPVRGQLSKNYHPSLFAKTYEESGVACLSVVTDNTFCQGTEKDLDDARNITSLPILRKDFIIEEYQVFESCAMGADCIVLFAAFLSHEQLNCLTRLSYDLGMDVIVSVYNLQELDKVAGLPIRMVAISNRDLNTFEVDLEITTELVAQIPKEILVITEGGIQSSDDVALMNSLDVNVFLLGDELVQESEPEKKIKELLNNDH